MEFRGDLQLTRKGKPYLITSDLESRVAILAPRLLNFLNSCRYLKSGRGDMIREAAIVYGEKTRLNGREVIQVVRIKIISEPDVHWTIGVGDPPVAAFDSNEFSGFLYTEDSQLVEVSLTSDFKERVLIENKEDVFDALHGQTCEPISWPSYFERVSGRWTLCPERQTASISKLFVWRGVELYELSLQSSNE